MTAPSWFDKEIVQVLAEFETNEATGLSTAEARARLAKYGPNRLSGSEGRNPWSILRSQFSSLMVLLLIAAALVSGVVLGEREDAAVILVIVVLNAVLGFRQEYKAEKAMAALKALAVPAVRVRRDGGVRRIAAVELVPGDMVELEAGNLVPADCRLVESANLRIQESALTGEAEPVEKVEDRLADGDAGLGDRRNMAHMGTVVTYGRGTAVVTATGMQTELGHIADMIQTTEEEDTVLQRKLNQLSKVLVVAALILITVVGFEAWFIQKMGLREIFMTAVSMAVAAIPEGLPTVVTISLALGAQRMLKRNALIRRLPAVETLGSVTVICSDKTGTLTQNRMTVTTLCLPGRHIELPADAPERSTQLKAELADDDSLGLVLAAGALCNDAVLREGGDDGHASVIGDPTEGALVTAAAWAGMRKNDLQLCLPRVDELPFDSDRKRMTTVHTPQADLPPWLAPLAAWLERSGESSVAFTKGAVDSVLDISTHVRAKGRVEELTDEWRRRITEQNETLAGRGIRVLGLAMRGVADSEKNHETMESDSVFLGMVGMLDPLRTEVVTAVETCHRAGIRPIMITGDHPLIAQTIGGPLGLESPGGPRTGKDLEAQNEEQLRETVRDTSIYARVSPEHKLRIVDALRKNGQVVAMTGDGVNDAPALKKADIGVAMGITGTDVSKEAADMVLQDDNFATIVAAVEQGRVILDNLIRFVRYILASNWAEILVMLCAPLLGMPLPLFPVQILWMNLVTDGLPALALGVEPGEQDVMNRPPRSPTAPIFDWSMGLHVLVVGTFMAGLSLWIGRVFFLASDPVAFGGVSLAQAVPHHGAHSGTASTWQTMVFCVLVFSQLTLALAERSSRDSFFRIGVLSNPYMLGAVALTFALQIGVLYVPFLQRFFKTVPLSARRLLMCVGLSLVVFAVAEIKKAIGRAITCGHGVPRKRC